jgi:predicted kinase
LVWELRERASFHVIRPALVRQELTREEPFFSSEDFYRPEWTDRIYAECLRRASQLLSEGKRVVVDDFFNKEAKRKLFLDLADRCHVLGLFVLCRAKPETVRERLAPTEEYSVTSMGLLPELETFARRWEELGDVTRRRTFEVTTDCAIVVVVDQVLEHLKNLQNET